MGQRHTIKAVLGLLLCAFCAAPAGSYAQSEPPRTIGAETLGELELGFVVWADFCDAFSADDRLLSNYDLVTGQQLYDVYNYANGTEPFSNVSITQPEVVADLSPESHISHEQLYVRPDSNLLVIQRLGVFELMTGRKEIDFYGYATLSDDGSFFAIAGDGLYRTADRSLVMPLSGDSPSSPSISPDNKFIAVDGEGLYEIASGERLFSLPDGLGVFSPDSHWLALTSGDVYDVQTGERLIRSDDDTPFSIPAFSDDGRWLAVADALYDTNTFEKAFDFVMRTHAVFSPDSQFVVGLLGIYAIPSGEQVFELRGTAANFSADGSLVATAGGNLYSAETGEVTRQMLGVPTFSPRGTLLSVWVSPYCLIYGLPEHSYPYRSGLVQPYSGANIRSTPSLSGAVLRSTSDLLVVTAQTADGSWLKVAYEDVVGWVSAEAVRIVEMPEGVPIEDV